MAHEQLQGSRVLITGAAGFVGGHLVELCLSKGAKVVGFDNFVTGSHSTIELLSKNSDFDFIEGNVVTDMSKLNKFDFDYIYNLASPASPVDFDKIPVEIMRTSGEGIFHVLNFAKEKNARVLQASTSEVYGDPEIHPQKEDYFGNVNPIGPRSCYDESKRYAEAMTMVYRNKLNVDTRIVRIFNTYGPRMRADDGRVISNFINQALKGEDITVYGDGSQTRSFCYVTDLINAMCYVMFQDDVTPFNIGNPDEYTIKEAAERVVEFIGSSSKVKYLPLPKDDPKRRRPNIDKLQGVCDYKPQTTFEEGLRQTTEFFKSLL